MRIVRPLCILLLVAGLLLWLPGTSLGAKPRKKRGQNVKRGIQQQKKKHHGLRGTVVGVHHSKDKKGTGSIKVLVHHHRKKGQNANKQAKAKPIKAAAGQQKRKRHTVKVHVHPGTKFAAVLKGMVAGKPQVKVVGRGRNKARVAVPGKPRMATRKIPVGFGQVKKGHHVHVTFGGNDKHQAKEVHIHPTKRGNQKQNKK